MGPQFIYFDLGNVILHFSRSRQYRQMGDILGVSPEKISQFVERDDLLRQSETGQITPEEAHRLLCCAAENDCDFQALALADSDIFELNTSIEPLIVERARCGGRMGILSNTSKNHWEFCLSRFPLLRDCFEHYVLSYEVGVMKPETDIYRTAIKKTGLPAEEIFYTDDLEPNVLAAKECGLDAVLFTDTAQLIRELQLRGLQSTF